MILFVFNFVSSIMASWQKDEQFAEKVAKLCFEHFKNLSKKGKPQAKREWTLLAAIVLIHQQGLSRFVSLNIHL